MDDGVLQAGPASWTLTVFVVPARSVVALVVVGIAWLRMLPNARDLISE